MAAAGAGGSGDGFDLAQGPLLRVRLLRLGAEEHVLLLTMHHIISDGWSMSVLVGKWRRCMRRIAGGEVAAGGVADPVCGLCGVAAGVAGEWGAGAAVGVLAAAVGRGVAGAGIAE